jgi:hypothetical protein
MAELNRLPSSNSWGYLPWALGKDVLERISLWQLE